MKEGGKDREAGKRQIHKQGEAYSTYKWSSFIVYIVQECERAYSDWMQSEFSHHAIHTTLTALVFCNCAASQICFVFSLKTPFLRLNNTTKQHRDIHFLSYLAVEVAQAVLMHCSWYGTKSNALESVWKGLWTNCGGGLPLCIRMAVGGVANNDFYPGDRCLCPTENHNQPWLFFPDKGKLFFYFF